MKIECNNFPLWSIEGAIGAPLIFVIALRLPDVDQVGDGLVSDQQFEASLKRLAEIHANAYVSIFCAAANAVSFRATLIRPLEPLGRRDR
jgi:hypothetical protein